MTPERKTSACSSRVCGLLHAKVPALGKKRGLPTWKVWKALWVTAKQIKSGGKIYPGLHLHLSPIKFMHSNNGPESKITKIFIPEGSTIRRTNSRSKAYVFAVFVTSSSSKPLVYLAGRSESESQRWMNDFIKFLDPNFIHEAEASQFEVTSLPGPLSSNIGLSGIMGRLGIRNSGVALREPSKGDDPQGRLLGAWGWRQIDHARCRLAAAALPEDDGKICVIRTTSLFPGGAGDLTVFCSRGRQLIQSLQNKTTNLLANLGLQHQRARRMSRSEGDLRFAFSQLAQRHTTNPEHLCATLPQNNKLASSLINAGMNLAVPAGRSRSYSEYNPEESAPYSSSEDNSNCSESPRDESSLEEEIGSSDNICVPFDGEQRRVSNVSVASGVYETIEDDDEGPPARFKPLLPPPLPPREYKKCEVRRQRGGLHAFFRLQKLWRSSSDSHVAKEEDEDCDLNDTIYSEVLDLPESPNTDNQKLEHLFSDANQLSNSCSNIPNHANIDILEKSNSANCVSNAFENVDNILMIDSESPTEHWDIQSKTDSEGFADEDEPLYLPMGVSRRRFSSESGISSYTSSILNRLSDCTTLSDDSIYVTMSSVDRKASLNNSDIYALVTNVKPEHGIPSP